MCNFRVGHGYDVHRFAEGRRLILGGVHIPCEQGLDGHSDADVLVHAIMDAILGAIGGGDIGKIFPDTSEEFKEISSLILLEKVAKIAAEKNATIVNIDSTLVLQQPKIAPYISRMIDNIAEALGIDCALINVKATTEEHLGFTGRCEGAAAHAVVLISF